MSEKVNPSRGASRRGYDASGRRARAQQAREEVAETARRLFEQDGYAPTTMADVARAANVRGSIRASPRWSG
jgi:AcrR family transcriptional regulator